MEKKKGNILLIFLVVSLIVLVAIVSYLFRQKIETKTQLTTSTTEEVTPKTLSNPITTIPAETKLEEAKSLTDLPLLYPKLSWKKNDINQKFAGASSYILSSDKGYIVLENGEEWKSGPFHYEDKWPESMTDFRLYYDTYYPSSVFPSLGWKSKLEINGISFDAPGGNGPGGTIWGTIGLKDDKFRVVVFTEVLKSDHGRCPCDITFYIFLSDIIPINNIPSLLTSY